MHSLCEFYVKKQNILKDNTNKDSASRSGNSHTDIDLEIQQEIPNLSFDTSTAITAAAHNNLEEGLSLIEKTALRVKPILEEVIKRMIPEKGVDLE